MKMNLVAFDVWLWTTLALTALATVVTTSMMIALVSVTSVTVISYLSTGVMCRLLNALRLLIAGLLCR